MLILLYMSLGSHYIQFGKVDFKVNISADISLPSLSSWQSAINGSQYPTVKGEIHNKTGIYLDPHKSKEFIEDIDTLALDHVING